MARGRNKVERADAATGRITLHVGAPAPPSHALYQYAQDLTPDSYDLRTGELLGRSRLGDWGLLHCRHCAAPLVATAGPHCTKAILTMAAGADEFLVRFA